MAITKADVKLMESQELSDAVTGGGLMTTNEVIDGAVNNLFADISRLDRTLGRVSLRKCFPAVQTADSSEYFGAHAIITSPATDPAVDVTLFETDDPTDRRPNAKADIESYVIRSTRLIGNLYGVHPAGLSQITLINTVGAKMPAIGETIEIIEDFEQAGEFSQFLKLSGKTTTETVFIDPNSGDEYTRDLSVYEITEPLNFTFHGAAASKYAASSGGSVVTHQTSASSAARYYGIRPLSNAVTALETKAIVSSIYAQVTPSAQAESVLADAVVGGYSSRIIGSSNNRITNLEIYIPISNKVIYIGSGINRGSLTIIKTGTIDSYDDGKGNIISNGGSYPVTGTVDYASGKLTLVTGYWGAEVLFSFDLAVSLSDVSDTAAIDITAGTRSLNYVKTLIPIPAPATLLVEYMANGNWYSLKDDGLGILESTAGAGIGTGTIDYATGTAIITLAALPDVGSKVFFSWGGVNHYEIRDNAEVKEAYIDHTVPQGSVVPSSLTITWLSSGVTKTATDNGLGSITGDATGGLIYSTGEIAFLPTSLPDPNSTITYDYDYNNVVIETFTPSKDGGGNITLNLTNATPIEPGSVIASTSLVRTTPGAALQQETSFGSKFDAIKSNTGFIKTIEVNNIKRTQVTVNDDGAGSFAYDAVSSVGYTANAVIVTQVDSQPLGYKMYSGLPSDKRWLDDNIGDVFTNGTTVTVKYKLASATPTTVQSTIAAPSLEIYLCPTVQNKVIPGSVRFTMAGHVYIDRSGTIYRDIDPATNSGTVAGTIDYASSLVMLTNWVAGSGTITVQSLLTQFGEWSNYEAYFRTAGSPLRPASFSTRANKVSDGSLMNATADQNGIIDTSDMAGTIDVNTGVAKIRYGQMVVAAGNEGQDWYDVLNLEYDDLGVATGNVWQPEFVVPNSSLYNAVTFSSIPVDPSIVGINPSRLPSDGRVPIYNVGGVAVIHETESEALPSGLVADQEIILTGTGFDLIELYDQNKAQVDYLLYTVDLATSTVTMGNPLDLSAYTQPLIAYKRKEDMLTISDVQINGELSFASQIQNDYTTAAFVSSALLIGDMASRYNTLFDQQTWTNVWSDIVIGSNASATFNELTYPLLVQNNSAIKERWVLQFTGSTTVNVIGERAGQVLTGASILSNIAPINPISGLPYFTISAAGFGGGWSTGNALRFNTTAANAPIWINRTTMPSDDTLTPTDDFVIQIRGDAS